MTGRDRPDGRRVPDVYETTTPTGVRVRVVRDPDSAAQVVTDLATGLPYEPPTHRTPVDDGVTDAQLDRRWVSSEWWAMKPVVDP
ncbi:hypothetical protein IN07_24155 [Modestobacter caceresii]|jgi:hypothetical protein|uniref:Uncharacterized protein n=1 Tax=Modestobacter caceresii TaxID=1522368 RepID=A0A098Y1I2_9ACTN|nr:hypothetical protein [Modestobacter caceresii]KGH43233.1 hypothetical protein IN07_24155 [Modestobacter caceresii]